MKAVPGFFLAVSTFGYVVAAPPATSVERLLDRYFIIHKSLASDSTGGVAAAAIR